MATNDNHDAPARATDLLATLSDRGPEYGPVLAHELDEEWPATRGRCRRLSERGLVERVTAEPLYRLTGRGRELLALLEGPRVAMLPGG